MKVRFAVNLGLWIGVMTGTYVLIYTHSPLAAGGVLPCTFVTLPLFLAAGGKGEDVLNHCSSAVLGVGWAALYLFCAGALGSSGLLSQDLALPASVVVCTALLCGGHILFSSMRVCSHIPMIFGGVASTFFAGVDKWPYLVVTLCLGVLLGVVNNAGARFLDASGRWMLPRRAQST